MSSETSTDELVAELEDEYSPEVDPQPEPAKACAILTCLVCSDDVDKEPQSA